MIQVSSRWTVVSCVILLFFVSMTAQANDSYCKSWTDEDFAADSKVAEEFNRFVVSPDRFENDLNYRESSPQKNLIDKLYKYDTDSHSQCAQYAVRGNKISPAGAAGKFAEALYRFYGCGPSELKRLMDEKRERSAPNVTFNRHESDPKIAPDRVERLTWAAQFLDKTKGTILFIPGKSASKGPSAGVALFKLKTADGKTVVKRVNVTTAPLYRFCDSIPALELKLLGQYEMEWASLNQNVQGDGTEACLAWFASNAEFNGRPHGTGLLSYLKIEPVSASKIRFDQKFSELEESTLPSGNKKILVRPIQSIDYLSIERNSKDQLVTGELFTSGVQKSKPRDDQYFNKRVEFDYSTGRCRPRSIEFVENVESFKVDGTSCSEMKSEITRYPKWSKLKKEMTVFLKKHTPASREPSSVRARLLKDSNKAIHWFCGQFSPYWDMGKE